MFGLDTDPGSQAEESRLTTDGASACEMCCQLVALSLIVDISLEDIARQKNEFSIMALQQEQQA